MYSYTDHKSQAKPKQYQDKTLYNIKIQTYSSTNLMLISTKELMKSSLKSDSHISDIRTQSKCHFTPDYQLFLNRNLCLILKSNNQLFWSAHRHHDYGNSTEKCQAVPCRCSTTRLIDSYFKTEPLALNYQNLIKNHTTTQFYQSVIQKKLYLYHLIHYNSSVFQIPIV